MWLSSCCPDPRTQPPLPCWSIPIPPPHPCLLQTHLLLLSASPSRFLRSLWTQAPFLSSWAWCPHCLWGCPQSLAPENPVGTCVILGVPSKGDQAFPGAAETHPLKPAPPLLQEHLGLKARRKTTTTPPPPPATHVGLAAGVSQPGCSCWWKKRGESKSWGPPDPTFCWVLLGERLGTGELPVYRLKSRQTQRQPCTKAHSRSLASQDPNPDLCGPAPVFSGIFTTALPTTRDTNGHRGWKQGAWFKPVQCGSPSPGF